MYSKGLSTFGKFTAGPSAPSYFFLYNNVFTKINTTKSTFNSVPVAIV